MDSTILRGISRWILLGWMLSEGSVVVHGVGSIREPRAQEDALLPPHHVALEPGDCRLSPYYPDQAKVVRKLASSGTTHLIKYELRFPEYTVSPVGGGDNSTRNYKSNTWFRVLSTHGLKLITMAFNYDALSLTLLQYGVETMTVPVVDRPPDCFGVLSEGGRMSTMFRLMFSDLDTDERFGKDSPQWEEEKDFVCHQMVQDNDGKASLVFRCCSRVTLDRMKCITVEKDGIFDAFHVLLAVLRICFVLFSPIVLQRLLFEGSTKNTSYVVPVTDQQGLNKTILVKKVRGVDDEATSAGYGRRKDMKQFTRFRKLVKTIPSEAIAPVTFNRLDILVDHKELMTERNVPVGLFRFIYDSFIRCGITRVEPLRSCCQESIFGSWSPRFLWLKLRKRSDCNRGCRDTCSWSSIFHFVGIIVLILLVPFPYFLRIGAFYAFERDEIDDRQKALDRLDLDYSIDHNIAQWLTPTHASFVTLYIVYLVSLLLLSALRICDASKVDGMARSCVTDMRNIRQLECLRMICAHVLLPFEKFGVFGVLVAVVYWPVVLPICLAITIFYCVPLIYMAGRLLVNFRPSCCRRKPLPNTGTTRTISGGVTSFDSCFFLESISPDSRPYSTVAGGEGGVDAGSRKTPLRRNMMVYRQRLGSAFGNFLVGALILLAVTSVLVMYAETFGFLVEMLVLTGLGAIVNSDRSVQYIILFVWGLVYVTASCHLSFRGYARLSSHLFAFIKSRLSDAIQETSTLRQEKRRNTAFKYFTRTEAVTLRARDLGCAFEDEDNGPGTLGIATRAAGPGSARRDLEETDRGVGGGYDDSIEYRDNRLHWIVNTLVLFVDKNDVSRIPVEFFWEVCKLDMPGSPGPVHRAALKAVGRILFSMLFLCLLAIIVLSFGRMYEVTTTIQMILMVVCGAIPLIVHLAVYGCSRPERACINEYSLRGKVQRVILGFSQSWPVYDLSFVQNTSGSDFTRCDGIATCRRHLEQQSQAMDKRCDTCGHLLDCRRSDERNGGDGAGRSCQHGGQTSEGSTRGSTVHSARNIDSMQVDLLITVKDEQEDDNIRSEPVSLGSGMSINSNSRGDRISPDDVHGTGGGALGLSSSVAPPPHPSASGVANQPTNATRSRMTESAEALQTDSPGSLGLRKQSGSASALPLQNHVTTSSSPAAAAAAASSAMATVAQADMVVDMADDVVFVKRIGFASPRNTVSMRSLPSYKQRSSESTAESAL